MMRLLFLISGLLLCTSVQALDWKSDITLSPQPMTYSGPADHSGFSGAGQYYRLDVERHR